jgi:hypothetical protein
VFCFFFFLRRVLFLRIKDGESYVLLTCDFLFFCLKLMCELLNSRHKILGLCQDCIEVILLCILYN